MPLPLAAIGMIAGGAADIYGAYKGGQAQDREAKFDRRKWEEEQRLQSRGEVDRAKTYQGIVDRRKAY